MKYFTFSSTSLDHIIAAKEEGMWAFRYQDNKGTNQRYVTKAARYAHRGDFGLFYCSEDERKGVAALFQIIANPISGNPSPEDLIITDTLWEPNTTWFLPVKLRFLTPIRASNIIQKSVLMEIDRRGGGNPEESGSYFINNFIAPQPTKSYTPLQFMNAEKFQLMMYYLETGDLPTI